MGRRVATVSQADVTRTLRAAKQAGARGAEVKPDGTVIVVFDERWPHLDTREIEEEQVFVL